MNQTALITFLAAIAIAILGLGPFGDAAGAADRPANPFAVNYSPWPAADRAATRPYGNQKTGDQLAQGPESCGCAAGQTCCEAVCCAASMPHYCASSNTCYQTLNDAQADCGGAVEVCGVPQ